MKASYTLAASIVAASTMALSSSSSVLGRHSTASFPSSDERLISQSDINKRHDSYSSGTERFAPRFDGLRFIETLITAHR